MALISCNECGKEISDKAASCPQCGIPQAGNSSHGGSSMGTLEKRNTTFRLDGLSCLAVFICFIRVGLNLD